MPFHPSCFEVFKHASIQMSGNVDVVGLTSWWSINAAYERFDKFPRDPNVKRCNAQEWMHYNDTAYLAANPLYIPTLTEIFSSAIDTSPDFNPRNGAFSIAAASTGSSPTDPFAMLPAELQIHILDLLPSKDIASLRLSSRTFSQMSVSYFQKLLNREMPWLWEAWPTVAKPSQRSYSYWATTTAAEAKETTQKRERELAILTDYVDMIKKDWPELAPQLDEAYATQFQEIQAAHERAAIENPDQKPFYLPPGNTNYFIIYTLITRHWDKLLGLQNRQRIWKDCRAILRGVKKYRKSGYIDENGNTRSLEEMILDYWTMRRATNNLNG